MNVPNEEIQAVKIELFEAMQRRIVDDGRDPSHVFGVQSTAVGEIMADLIYSSVKTEERRERLLAIVVAMIRSRWKTLEQKR